MRLTYHPYTPYEAAIELERFVADAEVILGYHADFPMDRVPRLRWLHCAPMASTTCAARRSCRVTCVVTNTRLFGTPIAEYVFASALAFYRDFPRMHQRFQTSACTPPISGRNTAATSSAARRWPFMVSATSAARLPNAPEPSTWTSIGTRRSVTEVTDQDGARVYPAAALHEVLALGDIVVISLPLTDETEDLIDERRCAR